MASDGYVASLAARHTTESEGSIAEVAVPPRPPTDDAARQNAEADLKRPVGNWAVYKYYFASAGWRNVWILALLTVCNATFDRFPGKLGCVVDVAVCANLFKMCGLSFGRALLLLMAIQ